MREIVLMMVVVLLVGGSLNAQKKEMVSTDTSLTCGFIGFAPNGDSIFRSVQIEASFPGGLNGWRDYLVKNLNTRLGVKYIKIPKGETEARATVIVDFLVDKKGNIFDVSADSLSIATVHKKIVAEAIRVIKEGPSWNPAWQCGKYVNYRQRQAITFVANKY